VIPMDKCTIYGHKLGCKGFRDPNCDIYGKKADKSLNTKDSYILGSNKAQLSLTNLIVICVVLLLYLQFVPVLIAPSINAFVLNESGDTNPLAPAMIAIAQAIPFLMLVAIIVGAFMSATPRAGQGY